MKWFEDTPTGINGEPLPLSRIDTLNEILSEKYGSAQLNSVVRLRSKKNVVVHLKIMTSDSKKTDLVAKMFIGGRYQNELAILSSSWAQGLAVPEVIEARDDVILMAFIPGEILVDRINQTFEPELADKLASWYYKYHITHKLIKADPRLRNFIYYNNEIFGVDFEESRSGHWMDDIGGVCASLLDTNPIFDIKKRVLSWHLLDTYLSFIGKERNSAIETMFITTIADTLKQTAIWRKDTKILDLSEQIRNEGLPEH